MAMAYGQCRIEREAAEEGERPERLVVENGLVRLRFDLEAPGGRCREYTIKPLNRNLILPMKPWPYKPLPYERSIGYFLDRLGEFRVHNVGGHGWMWPQYLKYKLTIVENSPRRAVVEFATVPNIYGVKNEDKARVYRQLTFTKRISLEAGSPLVHVQHIYHNFGTAVPITCWPECRINPEPSVTYYLPGRDGVHWTAATHQRASGQVNLSDPGDGWVGFIQRDGVGGAMIADDPSMLDGMELWCPGKDRSEGAMGLVYNQFVTDVTEEDLVIGYRFAPLRGLPRLDGIDLRMACGIDLESDKSLKLPGPDWQGSTQSSLNVTSSGSGGHPRHWLSGKAVDPGDKVRLGIHLLPWADEKLKLTAHLHSLDTGQSISLGETEASLRQFEAYAWKLSFTAPGIGTHVVKVTGTRGGQSVASFERPFVVQKEGRKKYRTEIPGPQKGLAFLSRRAFGFVAPESSVTQAEAERAVEGKGPFLFQFASQELTAPWPGMELVTPKTLYEADRGYGWAEGKPGVKLRPPRGLAREAPDFLGFHGVLPGRECQFDMDLADGDYAVALLSNGVRAPALLRERYERVYVGDEMVYERKLEGRAVVEDYYHGMNVILRRERDMWRDYIEPHLRTIRCSTKVTGGKLQLKFAGNLLLNALLVYPAAEKGKLDQILLGIAQERKKENKWRTEVASTARPGVPPTPEEAKRGYRVIALPSVGHTQGFGSAPQGIASGGPLKEDLGRKFEYVAARDMWLSFRVGIQPLRDLTNCRVTTGDFVGPGGAKLPPECVRVGVWKYLPVPARGEGYVVDKRLLRMPPETPAFKRIPIDKGVNRYYWSVVRILPDAKPGLYRSTYVFEADSAPKQELPVTIRVYPFRLERPQYYWWYCMYEWFPGNTLERYLDDLHEHGLTCKRVKPAGRDKDGKRIWGLSIWSDDAFDPKGRKGYDVKEIERVAKSKGYHFDYSMMFFGAPRNVTSLIVKNDPKWRAELAKAEKGAENTYRGYRKYFEERGLKDRLTLVLIVGEGTEPPEEAVWHKATLRAAKAAGVPSASYQWRMAWREPIGASLYYIQHTADSPYFSEEGRARRRKHGMDRCVQYFASSRFGSGFHLYRNDLCGATEEGYGVTAVSEGNRPFNELDSIFWHWCHCYPSPYGPAPCFDRRWERFREGSTDYSFLYALKTTCGKLRKLNKPGAAEAAADGMRLIDDTVAELGKKPNDQYAMDDARRALAERTVKLMKQFGLR